jgi:hypothetical protein
VIFDGHENRLSQSMEGGPAVTHDLAGFQPTSAAASSNAAWMDSAAVWRRVGSVGIS